MDELKRYLKMVDNEPFFRSDYPDIDVIRVEDTYYCITTTMHFYPGAQILSSLDCIHWKHCTYVYDTVDSTDARQLKNDLNIYGKGMWAASIRYNKGTFYVCFVANDTGKTYLFRSSSIKGPWKLNTIEGFYHDCSLLFDDDGKTYIAYGNRKIFLTELNSELTAPKEGGLHRAIANDADNHFLGYEGSSAYKINGTYYFFFIHSLSDRWRRVEACFWGDSLTGEFIGKDVCNEDLKYRNAGIAQGCIVDTLDGKWLGLLFQDRGAVGRSPVLMPVHFEGKEPVFESPLCIADYAVKNGVEIQDDVIAEIDKSDCIYMYDSFDTPYIGGQWQWNHEPELENVRIGKEYGGLVIRSGKVCSNLLQTPNILTHRLVFPETNVSVKLDASKIGEGDYTGLMALLGSYKALAVTKIRGKALVLYLDHADINKKTIENDAIIKAIDAGRDREITLNMRVKFGGNSDIVEFGVNGQFFEESREVFFNLDHFTGCRAGLFMMSTVKSGGYATFSEFKLEG